jgi:hypothetical protein
MQLSEIYYVTVSISAIVATITFIVSVFKDAGERRERDIQKWQRALVQQILQNETDGISFDGLIQRYRNEAVAFKQHNLKGEDLSPQSMRLILTRMITDRLVEQLGGDKYRLTVPSRAIDVMRDSMASVFGGEQGQMAAVMQKMMIGMMDRVPAHLAVEKAVQASVLNLLNDEPFRHSIAEVAVKLSSILSLGADEIRAQILQMMAKKWIANDDRGRLGLGPIGMSVITVDED